MLFFKKNQTTITTATAVKSISNHKITKNHHKKMYREWKVLEYSGLNWVPISQTLHIRDCIMEGGTERTKDPERGITSRKQFLWYTQNITGKLHMWTLWLITWTIPPQAHTRWNIELRRESGLKLSSLLMKLFTTDSSKEREDKFILIK